MIDRLPRYRQEHRILARKIRSAVASLEEMAHEAAELLDVFCRRGVRGNQRFPMSAPSQTPLTPLRFLERSAEVYPDKIAIVHGERRIAYRDFAAEANRLARALHASRIEPGDRVAYLCPNTPELLIAHFAVPLAGGMLVAINTRLASEEVRYICDHSGAKLLVVDSELRATVLPFGDELDTIRKIVTVIDPVVDSGDSVPDGPHYSDLLERGSDEPLDWVVDDELATITINYTSGTTGKPKGVMYTHRGAYLNSLGELLHSEHTPDSVYLWTLPMFHCNGWCTAWAVTAIGGRHVCLRAVNGERMWQLLEEEQVTHLNGAPPVLATLVAAEQARELEHPLIITTAGAPPNPKTIAKCEEINGRVVHVYGLTETYGPYSVCQWQEGWEKLDVRERAGLLSRQGGGMIQAERLRVVDEAMNDVPADGETMGEIVMRGNNVMKGYFEDEEATEQAFKGGWFHSGDLGVMERDGYVRLMDRAKDVVISGGENISTVEVEQALTSHDAVLEAAVIGIPDEEWGEVPKAFVVLKQGQEASEQEMIDHVKSTIARYKAPKAVAFLDELPKTSTGKVQKFELRASERAEQDSNVDG
jgi:fatty-acyl-CoA synthase